MAPIDNEAKKNPAAMAAEEKLLAVYGSATEQDRTAVTNLKKQAVGAAPGTQLVSFTPGMAALLFFDHNKQNRRWTHSLSEKYAKQITAGEWEFTNQGIGFLTTGDVGDGQHRLAAIALSGRTVPFQVTLGMDQKAIRVIDTGKARPPSDALEIEHLDDAKIKTRILQRAYSYLSKTDPSKKLDTNPAKIAAVYENNDLLVQSIMLGDNSVKGIAKPTFQAPEAQTLAFILLKGGWPSEHIVDKLAVFQLGQDLNGENTPLFIAAKQLEREAAKRERVSMIGRFGAAIKAFLLDELGVKAVKASEIREAMKPKNLPNPTYIVEQVAA